MNRAYSILHTRGMDDDQRTIEGIATTPSADRMGDVVESTGAKYTIPMPLLWQHKSDEPVGHVEFARPTKDGIPFRARIAKIAEPGELQNRTDMAWQSVKSGLVKAVSIGFRSLDHEVMKDGGLRFKSWEWLELSLVTIPANAAANITTIRSIDTALLAASGQGQSDAGVAAPQSAASTPAGVSATKTISVVRAQEGRTPMSKKTITEQISAFEATLTAKSVAMDSIMDKAAEAGVTLDAAQKEEYDTLDTEVKEIGEHIGRLRAREQANMKAAVTVEATDHKSASQSRGGYAQVVQAKQVAPKGVGFVRLLSARYVAKEEGLHPAEVALSRGWGEDLANVLRMPRDILTKAAVAPANTTDPTWAGPLVTYNNLQEEFIELLRPNSVISRIPGLRMVPFNVKVPRETGATTAYWVGQGSPKPVSAGALDTVTLDFAKVAGITFQTQELLRFSRPNSENLMINSLTKAITYLVDRDFLDPAKAVVTGVSPASITNGSTSITATGTTADAFRSDFGALFALFSEANYTLNGLVFVMTQTQALRLALMRNDFGAREFPDINKDGGTIEGFPVVTSENIVSNGGSPSDGAIIVAINANDVLLADDGAVQVDISTEASIQTDSAPDSPNTSSTTLVSLWQQKFDWHSG
jgi:HK97 family phage major capsid protein/HK97 family phage prohead protease